MFLIMDNINTFLDSARLDSDFGRLFLMIGFLILVTVVLKLFGGSNILVFVIDAFILIVAIGLGFLPQYLALLMFLIVIILINNTIRSGNNV